MNKAQSQMFGLFEVLWEALTEGVPRKLPVIALGANLSDAFNVLYTFSLGRFWQLSYLK